MTERPGEGTKSRRWVFGAELEREGTAAVIRLRGRLSYAATAALDAALTDAIGQTGTQAVLDLSAVDYVSGGGAARLAGLADQLAARGGGLQLRGLQDPVRQVLDYAGVLAHPAVASRDAATPAAAVPAASPAPVATGTATPTAAPASRPPGPPAPPE